MQPTPAFRLDLFTPRDGKFRLRAEVAEASAATKGTNYFFGWDCVTLDKP